MWLRSGLHLHQSLSCFLEVWFCWQTHRVHGSRPGRASNHQHRGESRVPIPETCTNTHTQGKLLTYLSVLHMWSGKCRFDKESFHATEYLYKHKLFSLISQMLTVRDSPVAIRVKVKAVSTGLLKCWVQLEENQQRKV